MECSKWKSDLGTFFRLSRRRCMAHEKMSAGVVGSEQCCIDSHRLQQQVKQG